MSSSEQMNREIQWEMDLKYNDEEADYVERVIATRYDESIDPSSRKIIRNRFKESLTIIIEQGDRCFATGTVDGIVRLNLTEEFKELMEAIWAEKVEETVVD